MPVSLFRNILKFRSKNCENVDVTIVEHNSDDCLEIIAFNPVLDQEAPRIYVDYKLLKEKLDNCSPLRVVESANKFSLLSSLFTSKVQTLNVTQYLATRLEVPELSEGASFNVHLIAITDFDIIQDKKTKRLDIEFLSKPDSLVPFQTQYFPHKCGAEQDGHIKPPSQTHKHLKSSRDIQAFIKYSVSNPAAQSVLKEPSQDIDSIFSPRPEMPTQRTSLLLSVIASAPAAPGSNLKDYTYSSSLSSSSTCHRAGVEEGKVNNSKLHRDRVKRPTFDLENVETTDKVSVPAPPVDQLVSTKETNFLRSASGSGSESDRSDLPSIDRVARRMSQVGGNMTMSASAAAMITVVGLSEKLPRLKALEVPMLTLSRNCSDEESASFRLICLTPNNTPRFSSCSPFTLPPFKEFVVEHIMNPLPTAAEGQTKHFIPANRCATIDLCVPFVQSLRTDHVDTPRQKDRPAFMMSSPPRLIPPLHSLSVGCNSPKSPPCCQSLTNSSSQCDSPRVTPRPILPALEIPSPSSCNPVSRLRAMSNDGIASPSYHTTRASQRHAAMDWMLEDLTEPVTPAKRSTPRRQSGNDLDPLSPTKYSTTKGLPPRSSPTSVF